MPKTVLRTITGIVIFNSITSGVSALVACFKLGRAAYLYAEDGKTLLAKTHNS